MLRKFSQKEVYCIYKEKGYELISEYINNCTKLFVKDNDGYICSSSLSNFKKNQMPSKFHHNNPYTIQNIRHFIKLKAVGYNLLSAEYERADKKLLFKCNKNHTFDMSWGNFQSGKRCPYCSNKKVELGTNTIWDTDKWMCEFGLSKEDAKKYTHGSLEKVEVVCPKCGKKKVTTINNIYKCKSIGCSCGDGVSYPEKFLISLLDQLGVKYEREYKPEWSNNKRYDFYLIDYNYIIECNGMQHYSEHTFKFKRGKTLQEEQENDKYKKQLALNNRIDKYIILDCRESDLDWIKNSVLQSKLNDVFDLSKIDWMKCEEFATSSLVREICDYWNKKEEYETTTDLANKFNLNKNTIIKYLKKGNILGLCNYVAKEEKAKVCGKNGKSRSKKIMMFKNGTSLGVFNSAYELERRSEELFGVKLYQGNIQAVCINKRLHHKGFTFKYITKEEYIQYLQNSKQS